MMSNFCTSSRGHFVSSTLNAFNANLLLSILDSKQCYNDISSLHVVDHLFSLVLFSKYMKLQIFLLLTSLLSS